MQEKTLIYFCFSSNRWLCCVFLTVNLKHLRVNDRKRCDGDVKKERNPTGACISDKHLESLDLLVSVTDEHDGGASKKENKK